MYAPYVATGTNSDAKETKIPDTHKPPPLLSKTNSIIHQFSFKFMYLIISAANEVCQ